MNAAVKPATMTVFKIETFTSIQALQPMLKELLPVFQELWNKGPNKDHPFDPDMDVFVDTFARGLRRVITGRRNGEVVAMQHWLVMPDHQCKGKTIAMMCGIYKRSKDACDTVDFIKFGIQTMRGYGANNIILSCYAGAAGLKEKMETAGCKLVEYVMEA
jgi:hypothetical protein